MNSPLNIVTPRSLMYISAKPVNKFYLLKTTFNESVGDITQVMVILKAHSSRILELYAKHLLQSYHKKFDSSCKSLEFDHFKINYPILFNQKRTGIRYSYKLFSFGVIQEVKKHRGSEYPRTIIVRCMERNRIVLKAVRPEDCMLLQTQGDIGLISSPEDFIAVHRVEYNALNKEINALKLRVKRLMTFENAKLSNTRAPVATGAGGPGHLTTLKLPRIQIPRFEDNVSGSVNWDNFRNMMAKLTLGMDPQEKIFILKSALTGESAKLVANEQSYDQAMSMLTSVYGKELLQLQSKIQEFIGLVHQEALEKKSNNKQSSTVAKVQVVFKFS